MKQRESLFGFWSSLAIAAGLAYWMEPRAGKLKARARDKAVHVEHELADALGLTARDLSQRSQGIVRDLWARVAEGPVDDRTLAERVRAKLGRVTSSPGAIAVLVHDGDVELKGHIPADELKQTLAAAFAVRGVKNVVNGLDAQPVPGGKPGIRFGLAQESWPPAVRLVVGGTGAWLFGKGFGRGISGWPYTLAGAALLTRAASNKPVTTLLGIGAGRRAIDLQKAIHIDAPVEEVFDVFQKMENFPRFMSHVREVRPHGDGCYRWLVTGPAGIPFTWDAQVVDFKPKQLLRWRTLPGSLIRHEGTVRFDKEGDGCRVQVRLAYNPPGGALGHAFAKILGADPKAQMDDDLLRLKSLFERGQATGHEKVTLEQVKAAPAAPIPHS